MKRRLSLLVIAGLPLVLGRLSAGCAAQGEGQRCSVLNNDDDCAFGLVCTPAAELNGNSDVCCLPSGNTEPACIPGGLGVGGSGTGGFGVGGFTSTGGSGGVAEAGPPDPTVSVSAGSELEYDTDLTVAPNGDVFVTWVGVPAVPDGGTSIPFVGYAISSDGGQTFPQFGTVTTPGGLPADHPTLAADAQNDVYLAWLGYEPGPNGTRTDTHVYVAVAPAGAKAFNGAVEASDPAGAFTYANPRVLVTPAGNPLVAFERSGAADLGVVAARSADTGVTWATGVVATDTHLLDDRDLPSPCASATTGRVFVTYFSDDPAVGTSIGIGWSDDDGVTWVDPAETPEVDQPDPGSNEYAVRSTPRCVAAESAVHVVYAFGSPGASTDESAWPAFPSIAYAESTNGGATFGVGSTKLVTTAGLLLNPQLVADPLGGYDLLYYQGLGTPDPAGTYVWGRSAQAMPFAFTPLTTIATLNFELSRTDATRLGDYTGVAATSTTLLTSYVEVSDGASHVRVHAAPLSK